MIINSSKQLQNQKSVYQTPTLEQNTQWQPLIQQISVPAGPQASSHGGSSQFSIPTNGIFGSE